MHAACVPDVCVHRPEEVDWNARLIGMPACVCAMWWPGPRSKRSFFSRLRQSACRAHVRGCMHSCDAYLTRARRLSHIAAALPRFTRWSGGSAPLCPQDVDIARTRLVVVSRHARGMCRSRASAHSVAPGGCIFRYKDRLPRVHCTLALSAFQLFFARGSGVW